MRTFTTTRVPDMFVWLLRQESWLHRQLQQGAFRKAQRRAMQRFMRMYPRWADSLFDDFFLSHAAAPVLAGYLAAQRPSATALAAAWAAQCAPDAQVAARPVSLGDAAKAAASFLELLDAELAPYKAIMS
ncbi:MAG: hypothetical protein DIU80_021220 [Chloroflexota bacterium]